MSDLSQKLDEFVAEFRKRDPAAGAVEPNPDPVKIIVAVHGIGDQFAFETVRSVADRFCQYMGVPAAIPLGRFHNPQGSVLGAYIPTSNLDWFPKGLGFAEIYWADVPRELVNDAHTLEESKRWARTIVERLHLRRAKAEPLTPDPTRQARPMTPLSPDELLQYRLMVQVLDEMIEGVAVLERLLSLTAKMGLFRFNLNKLLNDFLNDVQVVAEFTPYRERMLAIFRSVMEAVDRQYPNAEVYVVAHSEGTVVSFLGLLEGLSRPEPAAWTRKLKGYMTIGSPLNKHVLFWPELFDGYKAPGGTPPARIPWRNYYDFGDPIGFDLRTTRGWMTGAGWDRFFDFNGPEDLGERPADVEAGAVARPPRALHDHGFSRYYFPGAAHNDYWQDDHVFGHFIQEVVDPRRQLKQAEPRVDYTAEPPPDRVVAVLTSYVLPYALSALLVLLGVYPLYKSARACIVPQEARFESAWDIARNVAGFAALIGGMTVLARVPRLNRALFWRWAAAAVFAASAAAFHLAVGEENRVKVGSFLLIDGWALGMLLGGLAVALLGLAWTVRRDAPATDLRPMVAAGAAVAAVVFVLWGVSWDQASVPAAFEAPLAQARGLLHHPADVGRTLHRVGTLTATAVSVTLAGTLGVIAWVLSRRYPSLGMKPLIHTGGLLMMTVVGSSVLNRQGDATRAHDFHVRKVEGEVTRQRIVFMHIARRRDEAERLRRGGELAAAAAVGREVRDDSARLDAQTSRVAGMAAQADALGGDGPVWPVVVSGLLFLYLWWLAALLFDLTFVWHRYIRHSVGVNKLRQMIEGTA